MASASLRAYLGGEDTSAVRRQLVLDYLNTVPLAARPGYGEVNGIGDGMWVWYGRDFDETNRLLRDDAAPIGRTRCRLQAGALADDFAAPPSGYLAGDLGDLEQLTNTHLRLLAQCRHHHAGAARRRARRAARPTPGQPRRTAARPSSAARRRMPRAPISPACSACASSTTSTGSICPPTSTLDARLQQSVTRDCARLRSPKWRAPPA